jgi:glucosamine-6-phosphate deaminase
MKQIKTDKMQTFIYNTRKEMGDAAGKEAARLISEIIEEKGECNVIFAAAPSQNETLAALLASDVDFSRVRAFHMDEYVGLDISRPESFARYLSDHVFSKAPFLEVHYLPATLDAEAAEEAYTALLRKHPADVVLMGIGENGHIAFNDPPVADFCDPATVKRVELDDVCRMQQVHDGCFPDFDSVPKYALTLTVPALIRARHLICTVPAHTKAKAVLAMLTGPVGEACPATALRGHEDAKMYLDADSAALLPEELFQ